MVSDVKSDIKILIFVNGTKISVTLLTRDDNYEYQDNEHEKDPQNCPIETVTLEICVSNFNGAIHMLHLNCQIFEVVHSKICYCFHKKKIKSKHKLFFRLVALMPLVTSALE